MIGNNSYHSFLYIFHFILTNFTKNYWKYPRESRSTRRNDLSIPTFFIALTVIGIGSAIDDFAVGIKSVLRKKQEIGIGDALGSILNELLLFFGIIAVIQPIEIDLGLIWSSLVFLGISISLLLWFLRNKRISWKEGLVLVGVYAVFIVVEVVKFSV